MAETSTVEATLQVIFDQAVKEVEDGRKAVDMVLELAKKLEAAQLVENSRICSILSGGLAKRIKRTDRWFRKNLPAKYKQEQYKKAENNTRTIESTTQRSDTQHTETSPVEAKSADAENSGSAGASVGETQEFFDKAAESLVSGTDPELARKLREQKQYIEYIKKSQPADLKQAMKLIAEIRNALEFTENQRNGSLEYLKELGQRDTEHIATIADLRKKLADKQPRLRINVENPADEGIAGGNDWLTVLMSGPEMDAEHPLRQVQERLRATADYEQMKAELQDRRQVISTVMHDNDRLREQVEQAKRDLNLRATKEEEEEEARRYDSVMLENEELKAQMKALTENKNTPFFTTADQIPDFWVFMPRKKVAALAKELDVMNWKKNLPGISFRTDGKFVTQIKAGEPEG